MSTNGKMTKLYLYTKFERFWHWVQAILILLLLLSGFEIHGAYSLFGFEKAHDIHMYSAWTWLVLFIFIAFWLLTTGEWKQYIPTAKKVVDVARYYMIGIFKGEPHPVKKTKAAKHNPLQRLVYLGVVTFILPFQMITGLLYYYYNFWPQWGLSWSLSTIALLHMAGAFISLHFIVLHVYMTTTGHTVFAHIKSMFTGWEEVEEEEVQEWERRTTA